MNLTEIVSKYQSEELANGILVEYDLFLYNIIENNCRFAIDEHDDLEVLNNVIFRLKQMDRNAEIYVSTYGIDLSDNKTNIYADTLWINTIIELEEVSEIFRDFSKIEPSDIVLLADDEMIDGNIALVVASDGKVEDYMSFIEERQLSTIKSLYWD